MFGGLSGCGPHPAQTGSPSPSITLMAVGDILMHQDVKEAARQQGGFEPLWAEVAPLFKAADLVFGNLETPIAPITGGPGRPYQFNAPSDLPDALRRSGFTVLSMANNHAYDQGLLGVVETRSRLEASGLVPVGAGRNQAEAEAPCIIERDGIRVAFLAWTDLLNRHPNRSDRGPWVNKLEATRAVEAVKAARNRADAVVVSVHWGKEDRHAPTPRQRELASRLLEAGADLVLGHHPHVLQPLQRGETGGRPVAVAYSLGNFISNQDRFYRASGMPVRAGDERDGVALRATFTRQEGGGVILAGVDYTPLWTENNWAETRSGKGARRDIRVVRLDLPSRKGAPWNLRRERIRAILGADPGRPRGADLGRADRRGTPGPALRDADDGSGGASLHPAPPVEPEAGR